mmetsp:Transcript_18688/g.51280  ORF Transcript_18688/g.51280 Transcript_18688/m.51280 type:complete len:314 (-) Transcript_18688:60-1001(-)
MVPKGPSGGVVAMPFRSPSRLAASWLQTRSRKCAVTRIVSAAVVVWLFVEPYTPSPTAASLALAPAGDDEDTGAVEPRGDTGPPEESLVRPSPRVGPSVLASDLANLAGESQRAIAAGADFLHLDIFDGNWIPGAFSFGPMVVKSLRAHVPSAFLDAHLCVMEPARYVEELAQAGVNRFTFHIEAVSEPQALAARVRSLGMQVGLAIAPATPVDSRVLAVAPFFDVVLVMTVSPGFGGQKFLPNMLPKVKLLRATFPGKPIEVDGGINEQTVDVAAAAGASEAVAGTAVFTAEDPARVILHLRRSLARSGWHA